MFHGDLPYPSKEVVKKIEMLDETDIIGSGGFGTVHRLVMDDGSWFAVKKISKNGFGSDRLFERELEILGSFKHRNLVNLRGYCNSPTSKLLIYDYLPYGSLDEFLHGQYILSIPHRPPVYWIMFATIYMLICCVRNKQKSLLTFFHDFILQRESHMKPPWTGLPGSESLLERQEHLHICTMIVVHESSTGTLNPRISFWMTIWNLMCLILALPNFWMVISHTLQQLLPAPSVILLQVRKAIMPGHGVHDLRTLKGNHQCVQFGNYVH